MMQQLRRAALALAFTLVAAPALGQASQGSSPLSILKGGTGAISAAAARINLGFGSTANRLYGTDGSGVSTQVTLPAAGLTLSAGALTFANDLAALEALSSTGILRRTGTDTWTLGTAVANSELATMGAFTFKGNNTSGSATPTDVDIAGLTTKGSPASGDYVIISDQAASGAWKKATLSSIASAGSVSSIAGNTGAFTLSTGITNSTNDIRLALNNAVLNASPSNPTNTASSTAVMAGFGVSTCRITPVYSGRIKVTFTGTWSNNTNDRLNTLDLRYGTGTGPSNNVAVTGTQIGGPWEWSNNTADYKSSFSVSGTITGATTGVAIWLDLSRFTSGNTVSMINNRCMAEEF